jgi:ActR/RegA family two-component response regulator
MNQIEPLGTRAATPPARASLVAVFVEPALLDPIRRAYGRAVDVIVAHNRNEVLRFAQFNAPTAFLVQHKRDDDEALATLVELHNRHPMPRRLLIGRADRLSDYLEALHGGTIDHVLYPPVDVRELLVSMRARPVAAAGGVSSGLHP